MTRKENCLNGRRTNGLKSIFMRVMAGFGSISMSKRTSIPRMLVESAILHLRLSSERCGCRRTSADRCGRRARIDLGTISQHACAPDSVEVQKRSGIQDRCGKAHCEWSDLM